MAYQTAKLQLEHIRNLCGLSVSDVHRIAGTSRTTIYALEAGAGVRKRTVVSLLRSMLSDSRCRPAASLIRRELKFHGAAAREAPQISEYLERLDDIRLDTLGFANNGLAVPAVENLEEFEEMTTELTAALETLLENQRKKRS